MLIDWFTVGAQALNFLILVWLLKRFLYRPILDAIDAREEKIAAELADAAASQKEAQKERAAFQEKNARFDEQRGALFDKAGDEAKAERQRLLDEARQDAAALNTKLQDAVHSEAKALHRAIGERTQQEVFAIARKALNDLAGASLEERMVGAFVEHLQLLDKTQKKNLADALKASPGPAMVRSAFDLPPAQRKVIEATIGSVFGEKTEVEYETAPALISGIELSTDGRKVAWSIADYLGSLEQALNELLKENKKPASKASADGVKRKQRAESDKDDS